MASQRCSNESARNSSHSKVVLPEFEEMPEMVMSLGAISITASLAEYRTELSCEQFCSLPTCLPDRNY